MGLASRHERSDKDTADRVCRQTSTSAVLYPRPRRPGRRSRRPAPTVAVDVFVRPKDQTMNETREAIDLLASCKRVECQCVRNAFAINISPDAKAGLMWIATRLNPTRHWQTQIFLQQPWSFCEVALTSLVTTTAPAASEQNGGREESAQAKELWSGGLVCFKTRPLCQNHLKINLNWNLELRFSSIPVYKVGLGQS